MEDRKAVFRLVQRFRAAQTEFLGFVNIYTKFVRHSSIEHLWKGFSWEKSLRVGFAELARRHSELLDTLLDRIFLVRKVKKINKKTERLLEIIMKLLQKCVDFGGLGKELHDMVLFGESGEVLDEVQKLDFSLRENLSEFRKHLVKILKILDRSQRQGLNYASKFFF